MKIICGVLAILLMEGADKVCRWALAIQSAWRRKTEGASPRRLWRPPGIFNNRKSRQEGKLLILEVVLLGHAQHVITAVHADDFTCRAYAII